MRVHAVCKQEKKSSLTSCLYNRILSVEKRSLCERGLGFRWLSLLIIKHKSKIIVRILTIVYRLKIRYNLLRRGGPNDRMTVENIGKWQRVCSQHFVMAALLRSTRTQRCLNTITLMCQRVPGPRHG